MKKILLGVNGMSGLRGSQDGSHQRKAGLCSPTSALEKNEYMNEGLRNFRGTNPSCSRLAKLILLYKRFDVLGAATLLAKTMIRAH
jgi:hypothetical protein